MEAAQQLADRLRLTRQTLQEITEQERERDSTDLASDTSGDPVPLPPAYQDILAVLTRTDTGLHAKDLCHALHLDDRPRHIEAMRAKLKPLRHRHPRRDDQPGFRPEQFDRLSSSTG